MSTKNNSNKAVKTVSYIVIITLVGKILALFRDTILGRMYGISVETNAFLAASRIPRVLFDAIFASAITSSFIPMFNKALKKESQEKAYEYSDVFITCVGIFMAVLTIIGMIFTRPIASFFADGFNEETLLLCTKLSRILFPTMICTGIAFSFVGILQSMNIFIIPACISVVFNAVIIIYYFTFNKTFGIYGLAVTYLIGWILQVMIQVPSLKKIDYKYHFKPYFNYPYFRETLVLMLPVMVSTWVQPFNIMINTKYGSRLYEGGASTAIEFANNLYTMMVGVLVLSIMNVIFPKLSKLVYDEKEEKFNDVVSTTLSSTLFLVIPLMFGVLTLSNELIGLIYGGNKFDSFSVNITSQALFYFSLGMVGYAVQTILSRVYFARENGKIPMIGAIIAIVVNFVLCSVLVGPLEIRGLALASSISVTVNAIVLLIPLQLKGENKIIDRKFVIEMVKILVSTILMCLCIMFIRSNFLKTEDIGIKLKFINIFIMFAAGVAVYFASAFILKIQQVKQIKAMITKR